MSNNICIVPFCTAFWCALASVTALVYGAPITTAVCIIAVGIMNALLGIVLSDACDRASKRKTKTAPTMRR